MIEIENIPAKPQPLKKIRVAAYARVSSDKDAAFHSLEAQEEYYETYVAAHPDWELVGLYSDNGISGTIINRPEFQRMLEDCRNGKIDLVITKSVTRFARNTVVLLETIRELKSMDIDCYFEKEDMHSISSDGELLLTLLALYAEEEARSASENQNWRIQKKYDQGQPVVGRAYGYRIVDGRIEIVQEEAEIIRQIFSMYLSGKGFGSIVKTLVAKGITTLRGGQWTYTSIREILTNEKYVGDLLLQKYYTEDFRTKKRHRNTGQKRKVMVRNHHEAIIDKATFEAVQKELARRRIKHDREILECENAINKGENLFSGLIVCGGCGSIYQRKCTNSKKYNQVMWICHRYHTYGLAACKSQRIPEAILVQKTKEILGVDELTRSVIEENVQFIDVPEHNHLIYYLTNGDIVDAPWRHRSRRDSWTPEMRQAARERTIEQRRRQKYKREEDE